MGQSEKQTQEIYHNSLKNLPSPLFLKALAKIYQIVILCIV